jgi:hypothetical protein
MWQESQEKDLTKQPSIKVLAPFLKTFVRFYAQKELPVYTTMDGYNQIQKFFPHFVESFTDVDQKLKELFK